MKVLCVQVASYIFFFLLCVLLLDTSREIELRQFEASCFEQSKKLLKTQTSHDIKNADIHNTRITYERERKRNAERFLPTFASSIQSNETHASLYCVSNGKFEICHKATCQRTPSWRTRSNNNNNNSKKLLHQHHRSSSSNNNNNNNKEMTRRKLSRHRRI